MAKKLTLLAVAILTLYCHLTVLSQNSISPKTPQTNYHTALKLYENKKYGSALKEFQTIKQNSDGSSLAVDAEFYGAMCALYLGHSNAEKRMEKFLKDNPSSTWAQKASFERANFAFNNKHYASVIKSYNAIDLNKLSNEDKEQLYFNRGYSYFIQKKNAKALSDFEKLKNSGSKYQNRAIYYWAHISYLNQNFSAALTQFNRLKGDDEFGGVVPFYITLIYYQQKNYTETLKKAIPILSKMENEQNQELLLVVGSCYFNQKDFTNALKYWEQIDAKSWMKTTQDHYNLGYSYYRTSQHSKAIESLEKVTNIDDQMAQNAFYHLADCYLKTDEKQKARMAFERASEMSFDKNIEEDALFNYAKITYELSYSPFNETIKAFDKYIAKYPNNTRNSAAYDYLIQVFMTTKNYAEAIKSIEKIQNQSASVKKAYQRVAFFYGIEQFKNKRFTLAIGSFQKAIDNGKYNQKLKIQAHFWIAESYYRLNQFVEAKDAYTKFMLLPGAATTEQYQQAEYNLGYTYFKLKNYKESQKWFLKFTKAKANTDAPIYADALNRLGDCYFLERNYKLAIDYYNKSFRAGTYEADYALFQKAFCMGLSRNQKGKIKQLNQLLVKHSSSSLIDRTYYELGRAHEKINKQRKGIEFYLQLVDNYPNSPYYNKAVLQLGLLNYNQGNYKNSLKYYKLIAEKAPQSKEGKSALMGIKNNYIELNMVDEYIAYTKQLDHPTTISHSEQDSLMYAAAEKLFMAKNEKALAQLEKYVEVYPNGNFALNAHFYLAELLYARSQFMLALPHYEAVNNTPLNTFTEPSLSRSSELLYNKERYEEALPLFLKLRTVAYSKPNIRKADIGIIRCQYKLDKYSTVIVSGEKMLKNYTKSKELADELIVETNFMLAKSSQYENKKAEALKYYKVVAVDPQTNIGAESFYRIGQIYFQQGKLKEAESQIMKFLDQNSPHQYWLAKGLILLADIYNLKDDLFQAKYTLQSIVDNYPVGDDGILKDANRRLKAVREVEAAEADTTKQNR